MTLSEILGVAKNAIKQSLFKVEGKVEVDFPDIQRVELVNPSAPTETVEVSNLPALEESFSKAVFELGDNLIRSLEELQKSIPEDKTSKITEKIEKLGKLLEKSNKDLDLSKIIKGLSDIKKGIDGIEIPKTELDLKPVLEQIKQLGELIPDLSDYTKYGEFKVLLNPEQLDKLVKALNVSVSMSGGGGSKGTLLDPSIVQERGLSGTGVDTTITLTTLNTQYTVPASVPTTDYVLVLSNQSDTNILWGFQSSGTLGNLLLATSGLASMRLAGGQVIYVRCASSDKVLNYSTKIV